MKTNDHLNKLSTVKSFSRLVFDQFNEFKGFNRGFVISKFCFINFSEEYSNYWGRENRSLYQDFII